MKLKPFLFSFAALAVAAGAAFPMSAQVEPTATPLPTLIPVQQPGFEPGVIPPTWIPANGGDLPTLVPGRGEPVSEFPPTVVPPDSVICVVQPVSENVPVYTAPDAASPLMGVLSPRSVYTVFSRTDTWLATYFGPLGMGWIEESQVFALDSCGGVPLPTPTLIGNDPQFPNGTPTPIPMATEFPFTATPVPFSPEGQPTAVPPDGLVTLCLAVSTGMDEQPLYKGPGDTYEPNGFISMGQYLVLTQSDNGWVELVLLGQQPRLLGWTNAAVLQLQGNCERVPVLTSATYNADVWYPDF